MWQSLMLSAALFAAGPDLSTTHADAEGPGCDVCAAMRQRMLASFEDERPGAVVAARGLGDQTDVQHYHLDLEIVPTSGTVSGTNTMTVDVIENGVTQFEFELRSNFSIASVTVGGTPVGWVRNGIKQVIVTLDRTYNTGEQFDLAVTYSGAPVSVGFGSIEFTTHSGQPIVATLSEPWYSYTWWPVKEDNRDRASGSMWYTVPGTMKVAANGSLAGIDNLTGSRKRYRWETTYTQPPYLYCFSATNYDEFFDTWNYGSVSMPLHFMIYPESNTTGNRLSWLRTNDMLTVFSDLYGVYPFADEKYGIYQFPFGGGMEHQTMTGQGTFSESVTAHEAGHQWWGDMVTCAEWNDIWLNEGFATYSEALWEENKPGSSGLPALRNAMLARKPSAFSQSAYVYDATNANNLFQTNYQYRKGGWAMHMLRHVMGDAAFFDALLDYRNTHLYGAAITPDFQAACEVHYGGSLDWFFDTWVYDIGAAAYQYARRGITVNGQRYEEVFIRQAQSVSYPRFTMPIDLRFNSLQGTLNTSVWNDENAEHFLIPVATTPTSMDLDPDDWILTTSKTLTSFVEGPPKVIGTFPEPGAVVTSDSVPALTATFHKTVDINAADVELVGAGVGSVPFALSWDAPTQTATITPTSSLIADTYTLRIRDGVTDLAAGLALDGEMTDPADPGAFPSGEGLPGGDALVQFEVVPVCPGDANGDTVVDFDDLNLVLLNWNTSGPDGDLDGSGTVDFDDLNAVLGAWGVVCF
ncbi:MAG: Ig-like domain-containing protein [Phycisphaerales bacterium]|nr:Ig-like domain-containing protein [Phycisphaerales bacterium]